MQTQSESLVLARAAESAKPPLLMFAEFLDSKNGGLARQTFDLSQHDDRVKASKLLWWAANNKVELRINHPA